MNIFDRIKSWLFPPPKLSPIFNRARIPKYWFDKEVWDDINLKPKSQWPKIIERQHYWHTTYPGRWVEFHRFEEADRRMYSILSAGRISHIVNIGCHGVFAAVKVTQESRQLAKFYTTNPDPNWTSEQHGRRQHHRIINLPAQYHVLTDCEPQIHYVKWSRNRWKYVHIQDQWKIWYGIDDAKSKELWNIRKAYFSEKSKRK